MQAVVDGLDAEEAGEAVVAATPMMAQYLAIKAQHPDGLLFYRMGDFYEMFFDDADAAAAALGIHRTTRGVHAGAPIPMAGVPVHAAEEYLSRLLAKGFRVVVAEQVEDPAEAKKRGAKAVVARAVVRVVTPGTITEERLLDPGRPSLLVALAAVKDRIGVAAAEVASGRFVLCETDGEGLAAELARLDPVEVVAPEGMAVPPLPARATMSRVARRVPSDAARRLAEAFGVRELEAFGAFTAAEAAAGFALTAYLGETQLAGAPPLDPPRKDAPGDGMAIDAATRASLEITRARGDGPTLLSAVDRTVTGPGAQRLAERLGSPSTVPAVIHARQDAVAAFVEDGRAREAVRRALKGAPDLMRAVGRLAAGRGQPRDLLAVARALGAAEAAREAVPPVGAVLAAAAEGLGAAPEGLRARLVATLDERAASANAPDGFIAPGVDGALDEARVLRDESRRFVAALQGEYQAATGVRALKIKHNAVLGWFVEAPAAHEGALRTAGYQHRQSLASAVRFTTEALRDLESRILAASDDAAAREAAIFAERVAEVVAARPALGRVADAVAEIDVAAALAEVAVAARWMRPTVDDSLAFEVEGGRHPVVEAALPDPSRFVPNDCTLSPPEGDSCARALILTGPNMGGKSTYLRQNALLAVLAQAGSFVPAARAHIGVVDRLFSRIGASDDLAAGRSTFMVEMVELAAILHQAGRRALVILDEIGRGTATFDGLSIAWAALERLDETGCRTLFATHYHELTALADRRPRIGNATLSVKEFRGDIVFLHQVTAGAADRSYGVQVARLAGLPAPVVRRARDVLARLEETDRGAARAALAADLPLFAAAPPPPARAATSRALAALDGIDPDRLSPREALEALYDLKAARSAELEA